MAERDTMPPGDDHRRPDGIDDATVEAVGKLGEALESLERARGRLYDWHQLMGHTDLMLDEAAELLDGAGLGEDAERLRTEIIGRNVIAGRWTFQVVEEFDDGYYGPFRALEREVRDRHVGGVRHLFEAEMKERRRTHGREHHESRPPARPAPEDLPARPAPEDLPARPAPEDLPGRPAPEDLPGRAD